MNPILRQIQKNKNSSSNNGVDSVLADIQSGKIDPQEEVLKRMQSLNPLQKRALKAALPMLGRVGKKFGATDNDIQAIQQALQL